MSDEKIVPHSDIEKEAVRSGSVVPERILKHSKDADEAMKAFEGHEGEMIVMDEATNKRLLRAIDCNILPVSMPMKLSLRQSLTLLQLLCVVYGLNYLDSTPLQPIFAQFVDNA